MNENPTNTPAEQFKFRYVHAITGAFVLAIVLALIVAVVWTGRSQRWFIGNVTLRIELPETGAAGIRQGSEVYFLGTLMGTVADVSVDPTGRMEARVNIRRDFFPFVRADSSAVVKRKFGVVGDAYFEITRGHGEPLPEKNAFIVCNELEPSALETALEEIRREAVPALQKLRAGLDEWTELGTELRETRQHLHQFITRLDRLAATVEQGEGTAGKLLVDPAIADDVRTILAKINATMDQLQPATTNFPAIADSVKQSAEDLPALVEQTRQTMQEIERLMRGIQRHWLLRGAVRQADAANDTTNNTRRAKPR